ncbi:MAG TPA: type II toxin-antitoxin system VapC family toxin [Bryobacteraceae bacterium]|jgi:tRNA(fMet)-specific endonuclease VapC|nr:type II toxin-antitoxin system VapC family toxin [Bryobacteraceae bacterium]
MAIYLLDTSVIIDALNGKRGRWQLLKALVESGETLACSAMTVMEIYAGLRPHESAMTQAFMDGLEHYTVDRELGRYAGLLKNEWAKQGRTLSAPDVVIAATALIHKLVLMTDNRKDFPMSQLALYPLS